MLLTSYDPFLNEFDRLARRAFGAVDRPLARRQSAVPMDAVRNKDEVVLRFDLPGIDRESIDVTVDRGLLTVSARRAEERGEDEKTIARERIMGTFTRRLYLGDSLDSSKVEAAYADGVLVVRVPVLEKARPRKIEIQNDTKQKITA